MIHIRGNDRAAPRDFVADELGRNVFRNARAERFATMLEAQVRSLALRCFVGLFSAEILADRDELHLGRDDASARISQLRYSRVKRASARSPLESGKGFQ